MQQGTLAGCVRTVDRGHPADVAQPVRVARHVGLQGVRDEVEGDLIPEAGMVRQAELKQQHAAIMHHFMLYASVFVQMMDLDAHICFKMGLSRGVVDDVCWRRTPTRGFR